MLLLKCYVNEINLLFRIQAPSRQCNIGRSNLNNVLVTVKPPDKGHLKSQNDTEFSLMWRFKIRSRTNMKGVLHSEGLYSLSQYLSTIAASTAESTPPENKTATLA